jgi:hypothetical protein
MNAIESLVRKRVPGAQDVCIQLVDQLLHLHNRFSTDDFDTVRAKHTRARSYLQKRAGALCALCVQYTNIVAPYMAAVVFKRDLVINQRLLMLQVVE